MNIDFIVFAIPFFFLSIGWELWTSYRRKNSGYRFDDALTNLNIGIGSQAVGILTKIILLSIYEWVFLTAALWELPMDHPLAWIAAFLAFDCIFYWAHRLGHEINGFWGAHIVHHQSQHFNLSVALRQSWFHSLLAFVMFLPLAVLGIHPYMFVTVAAVNTIFQYWIHTEAIRKMPRWFEFIFNTPSHHRVHHAINPQYLDKNYAGTLIIWDRLFGTFAAEKERPEYGITTTFKSFSPVWANFHFYHELLQAGKKLGTIREKIALWFMGPADVGRIEGYRPENQREKPEGERYNDLYTAKTSRAVQVYILVQFVLLSAGLFKYLLHFNELTWFYRISGFVLIILTTHTCGGMMENRKWARWQEPLRLLLAVLLLNALYFQYYIDWFHVMLTGSIITFVLSIVWNAGGEKLWKTVTAR